MFCMSECTLAVCLCVLCLTVCLTDHLSGRYSRLLSFYMYQFLGSVVCVCLLACMHVCDMDNQCLCDWECSCRAPPHILLSVILALFHFPSLCPPPPSVIVRHTGSSNPHTMIALIPPLCDWERDRGQHTQRPGPAVSKMATLILQPPFSLARAPKTMTTGNQGEEFGSRKGKETKGWKAMPCVRSLSMWVRQRHQKRVVRKWGRDDCWVAGFEREGGGCMEWLQVWIGVVYLIIKLSMAYLKIFIRCFISIFTGTSQ